MGKIDSGAKRVPAPDASQTSAMAHVVGGRDILMYVRVRQGKIWAIRASKQLLSGWIDVFHENRRQETSFENGVPQVDDTPCDDCLVRQHEVPELPVQLK
jgi:hypothetical protein